MGNGGINQQNSSNPFEKKIWRSALWIVFAIILFGPIVFRAIFEYDLFFQQLTEYIVGSFLVVFVLFIAYQFWQQTEKDKDASNGEKLAQIFIFAIMVFSFYAFGWPTDLLNIGDKHKFAELSVIFVLFLLSELAAHQIRESRQIAHNIKTSGNEASDVIKKSAEGAKTSLDSATSSINNAMIESKKSFYDSTNKLSEIKRDVEQTANIITKANLTDVAEKLDRFNKISEAIEAIKDPNIKSEFMTNLADYAKCWASQFQRFENEPAKLKCWHTINTKYLKEEMYDLAWNSNFGQIDKDKKIMLASNERLYFELLDSLAVSVEEKEGYKPVYRAITNMRPSEWYNRECADGRIKNVPHIDKFRQTVEKFVRNNYQYDRAILVSDVSDKFAGNGSISSGNEFKKEDQLCLLSISTNPQIESSIGPHPIDDWKELFAHYGLNEEKTFNKNVKYDDEDTTYGLINIDEAKKIIPTPKTEKFLTIGQHKTEWRIKWEPIINHYVNTLHSDINSAKIISVSPRLNLSRRLPRPNPDWLIVGRTKDGLKIEWLMALTSSLFPKSSTMLVDIIVKEEELLKINEFWDQQNKNTIFDYFANIVE